jgi:hypothetical protein
MHEKETCKHSKIPGAFFTLFKNCRILLYSSSVTLTVLAYTVVFKYPIEKSKGLKSGEHAGQEAGASLLQLVQLPG